MKRLSRTVALRRSTTNAADANRILLGLKKRSLGASAAHVVCHRGCCGGEGLASSSIVAASRRFIASTATPTNPPTAVEADMLFDDLMFGGDESAAAPAAATVTVAASSSSSEGALPAATQTTSTSAAQTSAAKAEEEEGDDLLSQLAESTQTFSGPVDEIPTDRVFAAKIPSSSSPHHPSTTHHSYSPPRELGSIGYTPAFLKSRGEEVAAAFAAVSLLGRLPPDLRAEFAENEDANSRLVWAARSALEEQRRNVSAAEAKYHAAVAAAASSPASESTLVTPPEGWQKDGSAEEEGGEAEGNDPLYTAHASLAVAYARALAAIRSGVGTVSPQSPAVVAWVCPNGHSSSASAANEGGGAEGNGEGEEPQSKNVNEEKRHKKRSVLFHASVRDRVADYASVQRVMARCAAAADDAANSTKNSASKCDIGSEATTAAVAVVDPLAAAPLSADEIALFHASSRFHCPLCVAKAAASPAIATSAGRQMKQTDTTSGDKGDSKGEKKKSDEVGEALAAAADRLVNTFPQVAATWNVELNSMLASAASSSSHHHQRRVQIPLSHVPTAAKRRFWWDCAACRRSWRESPQHRTTIRMGSPLCPRCHSRELLLAETTRPYSSSDAASVVGKTLATAAPFAFVELDPSMALADRPIVDDAFDAANEAMRGVTADALGDDLMMGVGGGGDAAEGGASPTGDGASTSGSSSSVSSSVAAAPTFDNGILGTPAETEADIARATAAQLRRLRAEVVEKWARVPSDSAQVARWRCSYCSYQYRMSVAERALMGKDCPSCTGTLVYNRHGGASAAAVAASASVGGSGDGGESIFDTDGADLAGGGGSSMMADDGSGSGVNSTRLHRTGRDIERNPAMLVTQQRPDVARELVGVSDHSVNRLSVVDGRVFSFVCRRCLAPYRMRLRDRCAAHGCCPSCGGDRAKTRLTKKGYAERLERTSRQHNRPALRDLSLYN